MTSPSSLELDSTPSGQPITTTSDVLSQVVHGAPTGPPKGYVQVTRGVAANGSLSEAMGLGVEIAESAARITGSRSWL